MKLILKDLVVDCIIGDLPEEREHSQPLSVDVELEVEECASLTDRLEDTVDYAALAKRIRETLVAARCRMIERATRLVAETCRQDARICSVKVAVTKRGAIPGLGSATAAVAC